MTCRHACFVWLKACPIATELATQTRPDAGRGSRECRGLAGECGGMAEAQRATCMCMLLLLCRHTSSSGRARAGGRGVRAALHAACSGPWGS